MTQATFIWPYLENFNGYIYGTSQAEFADLQFGTGTPGSFFQGPRVHESGRPGGDGTNWSFTHDAIYAAGNQDINEIVFVMQGQGAAYNTCWYGVRIDAGFVGTNRPNGCLFVTIEADYIRLNRRNTSGTEAVLGSIQLSATGKNQWPLVARLHASGNAPTACKLKVWPMNEPEPEAWDIETTYSSLITAGIPFLARYSSGWPGFHSHFSMGVGEAAPNLVGIISGNVFEAPDTGVARTVRAVAREDNTLFFESQSAADGAYEIGVLRGYTYTDYAMDDDLNAGIKDRLSPV